MTKITPAPWYAEGGEVFSGTPFMRLLPHDSPLGKKYDDDRRQVDIEFIALARNALDVQMRRRWHAEHDGEDGWCVNATADGADDEMNWHASPFQEYLAEKSWPDPFTALVEADRWYASRHDVAAPVASSE